MTSLKGSCKKSLPGTYAEEKTWLFWGNFLAIQEGKMANQNNEGWIDISKIDWVIVPALGAIALLVYFIASGISMHG